MRAVRYATRLTNDRFLTVVVRLDNKQLRISQIDQKTGTQQDITDPNLCDILELYLDHHGINIEASDPLPGDVVVAFAHLAFPGTKPTHP